MARFVVALVVSIGMALSAGAVSAQDLPLRLPRQVVPQDITPPTVVITPSAAERIIELMTLYTATVAGGLTAGAFVTSLLTGNVVAITIGGIAGAALAMGGYASFVSGGRSAQPQTLF